MLTEYRVRPFRGKDEIPVLKTPSLIKEGEHNFRSVYNYTDTVVTKIRNTGKTSGILGMPVHSNVLFIDVDNEAYVDKVRNILAGTGVEFLEYTTGNRGVHFHIHHQDITGTHVVYSQKAWLREHGLWDYIDHSFYHESGQWRLIGAKHRATGRPKELVEHHNGWPMTLVERVPPPVPEDEMIPVKKTPEAVQMFFMNLLARREEGGRYPHMYILYASGSSAGFQRDEVLDSIRWWNEQQRSPYEDGALERKLRGLK